MNKKPLLVSVQIVLILLVLACGWTGIGLLIAEVNSYQANAYLEHWQKNKVNPKEQEWLVAYKAARRALQYAPYEHAKYYDQLGLVYISRYHYLFLGDKAAEESRKKALHAFRQSVQLRPHWPYTHIRLAQTKLALLELDEEFDEALHLAHRYGPWRETVNEPLAKLGLTAWHELTMAQRQVILEAIKRLPINSAALKRVMVVAQRYRHLSQICPHIDDSARIYQNFCRSTAV